jgi:hypothetical protein
MPRKVFTAGEVLAAADVNEFLMDQAVQSFAGTAARGSAIPSPVEGMVTYLEDTNELRVYDSSSWVSVSGMTLLANTPFTSVSSVNVDNIFSSQFQNYKVVINVLGSSAGGQVTLLLRTAVPGDISVNGQSFVSYAGNTNNSNYDAGGSQLGHPLFSSTTIGMVFDLTIFNPNQSTLNKHITGTFGGGSSVAGGQNVAGFLAQIIGVGTAAAGFRLAIASGTFTGNIRVYGLRNS